MTPEHSPTGASSYYRWKACPGSVRLSKGITQASSREGELGNRAHDLAELWIKNNNCPKNKFQDLEQEDFDAVEVYVNFVNSLLGDRNDPDLRFFVEHRFSLEEIYPGLYGTVDFAVYSKRHEKLVVVDYKHGAGLPVEVKENPQLQYYGVGAMLELNLPVKSVELVIVQPRAQHRDGPVRKWQTTPQALQDFLDQLTSDAKRTEEKDAPLNEGSWCRYCPAAAKCPKLRERSLTLVKDNSFSATQAYSPEALSDVLGMLPVMEGWIKNVKAFAAAEAQAGRIPPGWKLVAKRANRRWKDGWTGERLAQEFGLKPPEMFDQKVKSPAQVEKLLDKQMRSHVENLVERVSSGVKLVEDNDPSPALLESEIDSFTLVEF